MFAITKSNSFTAPRIPVATVADMDAARAYFGKFHYVFFEEDADNAGCADVAAQRFENGELVIYTVEPVKG